MHIRMLCKYIYIMYALTQVLYVHMYNVCTYTCTVCTYVQCMHVHMYCMYICTMYALTHVLYVHMYNVCTYTCTVCAHVQLQRERYTGVH